MLPSRLSCAVYRTVPKMWNHFISGETEPDWIFITLCSLNWTEKDNRHISRAELPDFRLLNAALPVYKRQLEHWSIPGDVMYNRLYPVHFAPPDLWTLSKSDSNDAKSTQCLFNLSADMKWGWVVIGANCPFTRLPGSWIQVTHPTHKLKVAVSFGDELSVKGPRKGDVEDGVTGHLTW